MACNIIMDIVCLDDRNSEGGTEEFLVTCRVIDVRAGDCIGDPSSPG